MGTMRIIDETGDTELAWTAEDGAALEAASRTFAEQRSMRRLAFARAAGATAAEVVQIDSFDPTADEIIWVRPITGG